LLGVNAFTFGLVGPLLSLVVSLFSPCCLLYSLTLLLFVLLLLVFENSYVMNQVLGMDSGQVSFLLGMGGQYLRFTALFLLTIIFFFSVWGDEIWERGEMLGTNENPRGIFQYGREI